MSLVTVVVLFERNILTSWVQEADEGDAQVDIEDC